MNFGQPPPIPNDKPAIADLVLADIKKRKEFGIAKYGVPLQPHNGRDALRDAYEEALDLVMYLRQAIEERSSRCDDCGRPDGEGHASDCFYHGPY